MGKFYVLRAWNLNLEKDFLFLRGSVFTNSLETFRRQSVDLESNAGCCVKDWNDLSTCIYLYVPGAAGDILTKCFTKLVLLLTTPEALKTQEPEMATLCLCVLETLPQIRVSATALARLTHVLCSLDQGECADGHKPHGFDF